MNHRTVNWTTLCTPWGHCLLVEKDSAILMTTLPTPSPSRLKKHLIQTQAQVFVHQETPLLKQAKIQLRQYFRGRRREFDLPLSPEGTDFQKRVWKALTRIPYGTTCSYQEIAKKLGKPKACRAVGSANRKNPIPLLIPCHRVIGKDGSLRGFAGGLALKRKLLTLEQGSGKKRS